MTSFFPSPPLFFSESRREIFHEKGTHPACNSRREGICAIWHRELRTQKPVYINFVKLTLSFLVTSSSCTTPSPNPLVLSFYHKFIASLSKRYKRFWFCSVLWVSFLLWNLQCLCTKKKKLVKFVFFSPVNFYYANLQTQPETLRRSGLHFPPLHFQLTSLTLLTLCALPCSLWLY